MEKKKIMIVDDEAAFGRLVKVNLEASGEYAVMNLTKGSEALAAAKDFHPDLIFLDVMMPDMDGGEVCSQIEEDEATKDIPVVFVTAIATASEIGSGDEMIGGHPFLAKPVTTAKLVECIKKYVGA